MENRKQIYSAMRDWKRENCPPYSKLNKAELEALVQSLGIPIPAEEPARAPAPKKKKIKPKFDKTPKKMIKPKKKKSKIKTAVEEAVKLGKKTIDEAPMRMIKPKKKKKNNLNLLQGLQGGIMGNIPLDLAPQAPAIPDEPMVDMPMGRFDAPVFSPLDQAPQAPAIPDEPMVDMPMGRFDAPVIKEPMGIQVQQAKEILLDEPPSPMGMVDLDADIERVNMNDNIVITIRTADDEQDIEVNPNDDVYGKLSELGLRGEIRLGGEEIIDGTFDDNGIDEGAVLTLLEDDGLRDKLDMILNTPSLRESLINRRQEELFADFDPFNPPDVVRNFKLGENEQKDMFVDEIGFSSNEEDEDEIAKYKPIVLLDRRGNMKSYRNNMNERDGRYGGKVGGFRSFVHYVKINGDETSEDDLVGIYEKTRKRFNKDQKPLYLAPLKNIKKGTQRGAILPVDFLYIEDIGEGYDKDPRDGYATLKEYRESRDIIDLFAGGHTKIDVLVDDLRRNAEKSNNTTFRSGSYKFTGYGDKYTTAKNFIKDNEVELLVDLSLSKEPEEMKMGKGQSGVKLEYTTYTMDRKKKKKGKATLSKISHFNPNPMLNITAPDGSKYVLTANRLFSIEKKKEPVEEPKPKEVKPKSKKQKGADMDIDEAVLKGQSNKTSKSTIVNILKALDAKRRVSVLKSVIDDDDTYDAIFEDAKTFEDYVNAMDEVEDEDTGQSFYEIFGEKIWTKARKNYTKL